MAQAKRDKVAQFGESRFMGVCLMNLHPAMVPAQQAFMQQVLEDNWGFASGQSL